MGRTWPASLLQRSVLWLDRSRPGLLTGPWFTMNAVVRFDGALDLQLLRAAAEDLLARHELLRTRLDGPVQVVEDVVEPDFSVVDDVLGPAEWLHTPVSSSAHTPLKLRFSPRERLLSLHVHHLLSDASTLWRVLDDLAALYSARCGAAAPAAPTGQYGEFAVYEADLMRSGYAEAQAWWCRALGDVRFASPAQSSEPFASRRVVLPDATLLESRARAQRSSPFALLLALLTDAMAGHVSAGDHLPFATVFLRRDHPRWRTMIGPCLVPVNLAVPLDACADLRLVNEHVIGAQRYSRFPWWETMRMNPHYAQPGGFPPFVELVPQLRPGTVSFGPVSATVVDAAGPPDSVRTENLGLRFRSAVDGALVTHMSGNGNGWARHVVDDVLDALPGRVQELGSGQLGGSSAESVSRSLRRARW
ncbi:condensation domain-containing protein [Lentzea tibetensis]|nr:condensation domain-containing protein [Lentzea tibetensis]